MEFTKDSGQLGRDLERWGQPESGKDAVPQETALHEHTVRGKDDCPSLLRLAQQMVIADPRLPMGDVSGGAQPASQAAQAGVAPETNLRECVLSTESAAAGKFGIDAGQRFFLGDAFVHTFPAAFLNEPANALVEFAGAYLVKQQSKLSFIAFANSMHALI